MAAKDYTGIFREEALELLEELETSVLALEETPEDLNLVGRVFRTLHTIKGSGSMFGFDEIADFTHQVETVFDRVRTGTMPVTSTLINLVLAAHDHIKASLEATSQGVEADGDRGAEIVDALQELTSSGWCVAAPETADSAAAHAAGQIAAGEGGPSVEPGVLTHYRIRFKAGPDFADSGVTEEDVFRELEKLGECSVFHPVAETGRDPQPVWDILLSTTAGYNAIRDVFIFVEHLSQVEITALAEDRDDSATSGHKRLGEILVERGDVRPEDILQVLGRKKTLGELLVADKLVSRPVVESALFEQQELKRRLSSLEQASESLRVPSERLDKLINLVGELVVTQSRLTELSAGETQSDLNEPVEEVGRLTAELRDCVFDIRMLPIGSTFGKFSQLVSDLAAELNKEVDLVTEGAATELDKTVLEKISDPLVHLIRNSIDHGLEPPGEREANGKPRRGLIRLAAIHSGATVVISIEDNGRGVDPEKIRTEAMARGFLKPGEECGDRKVFNLIFAPGFSTSGEVSSVSGRGVGMDVVKSAVDDLRGSVDITSSKGQGTKITITLPLTMAIIDGLLVRAGDTSFVLPLNTVEKCVEITSRDIERFHGRRLLPVQERLVPYVRLRDFFAIAGGRPQREQMVVVRLAGDRVGLVLDEVIGGHQTVIKSLGWIYGNAEGLSGSTILGSGEVALIIDVPHLIQHAMKEETARVGGRLR